MFEDALGFPNGGDVAWGLHISEAKFIELAIFEFGLSQQGIHSSDCHNSKVSLL